MQSLHSLVKGYEPPPGSGTGRSLPTGVLIACGICSLFASVQSFYSLSSHLGAYRKPSLQRNVCRLLFMVPIYSTSSFISLLSVDAAFLIDLIRDLYEAFVLWCFFMLLVEYLGGERSLIILSHGRPAKPHPWPVNLFYRPMDVSDPYTFLGLKRGILQYVQIKPVLAIATVLLKAAGKYEEGKLAVNNGYTYISAIYNISVFLSLYCLAMFWSCLHEDLAPFRVTSKFLCIKGIIFFTFWQGLGVSILVAAGLIKQIGPLRDEQYISQAVQDMLICFEMPLFAISHAFAFSPKDYVDPFSHYASRLPVYYALRDVVGGYDILCESLLTIKGTGYGYQAFEPSEGVVHQGLGRVRRSRAGLRYTQGGKAKYWLPQRVAGVDIARDGPLGTRHQGPAKSLRAWINKRRMEREGYAPLLAADAADVVRRDPHPEVGRGTPSLDGSDAGASSSADHPLGQASSLATRVGHWAAAKAESTLDYLAIAAGDSPLNSDDEGGGADDDADSESGVQFEVEGDEWDSDEKLYEASRRMVHGDYAFPNVDVAREEQRRRNWEDDERVMDRARQRKGRKMRLGRLLGRKGEDEESNLEGSDAAKKAKAKANASAKRKKDVKGKDKKKNESGQGDDDEGEEEEDSDAAQEGDGLVDLVVEDKTAEERERLRERRRGDPALRSGQRTRIFRRQWEGDGTPGGGSSSSANSPDVSPRMGKRPEMEPEERPPRAPKPRGAAATKGQGGVKEEEKDGKESEVGKEGATSMTCSKPQAGGEASSASLSPPTAAKANPSSTSTSPSYHEAHHDAIAARIRSEDESATNPEHLSLAPSQGGPGVGEDEEEEREQERKKLQGAQGLETDQRFVPKTGARIETAEVGERDTVAREVVIEEALQCGSKDGGARFGTR